MPQIANILRDPHRFTGILLHGDDPGLIRERSLAAARAIAPLDDPFLSCVLVKEEHGRLLEEARSLSMVGGRRVVRVTDAGDALAAVIRQLETSSGGALVILEAGGLPARSKLRQAAEAAVNWGSLACYPSSGPALATEIRGAAATFGTSLTEDAVSFLMRDLGADTGVRRAELEKLFVFTAGTGTIDLESATLCCMGPREGTLDALLAAVMAGNVSAASDLLQRVIEDGATGPGLIIALSGRVQRVLKIRLAVQAGGEAEDAIRALAPPVYFKDVAGLAREARNWPENGLVQLLKDARLADIACKTARSRDETIASQLYLSASRRAARHAKL